MTETASDPRVTVVVIFLNGLPYLAEAVESALAQTFRSFEIILVDDGSTDGSTELAQAYAERHPGRVRYLEHPAHENRGMSASRNAGAAAGRGDLIALLDADDVWEPWKLADQVAIFDSNPDVDLVAGVALTWSSWQGGADELVPSGPVQGRRLAPREATLTVYPLGTAQAPCPSNFAVRRTLFEAVGGFEESFRGRMQMYEDQAFLSKAYLAGGVYFSDRPWVKYRIHDESCMAANMGDYDQIRRNFLHWLSAYLRRTGVADPRVWLALWRAEFPYDHRRLHQFVEKFPGRARWIRRMIKSSAKRVLAPS